MDTTPNRGYDIPDSPSALFPQLRGTLLQIDSDVEGLDNENPLISTGAIIIGADSDASGTDGISLQTRGTNRLVVNNDGTIQIVKNDLLIGSFNGGNNAGRVRLATDTSQLYASFMSQTFDYANGPIGEENYSNNTFGIFYNSDWSGVKIVADEANMGLAFEPKFSQSGDPFQTEIYVTWTNPDNDLTIRPWGMVIAHATGDTDIQMKGDISLFRHASEGGAQFGLWYENGALDLSYLDTGSITVKNNIGGFKSKNAANSNTVSLILLNASDKVVIDPGGAGAIFGASVDVGSLTGLSTISGTLDVDTRLQWFGSGTLGLQSDGNNIVVVQPDRLDLRATLMFDDDNEFDFGYWNFENHRPRDIKAGRDIYAGGVLIVGSGPTTLTDSAGKILSAALNTVAVGQGGTGLTAPGTSGNVLTSNGSAWVSSAPSGGGSPGGSDTELQFNNAGAFGGSANLKWASGALSVKKDGSTATSLDSTAALRVGAITDTTTFVMGAEPSVATYIQSMEAGVSYTNRPLGFNPLGGKVGFGTPLADISEQYTFKMLDGYKMFFYRSAGIGGVIRFDNTGGVEGVDYGYDDGGGFKSRLRINERNTDIVLCKDGGYTIVKSANAAPTDSRLIAASVAMYLDESNNKLKFRVKYSDGSTLKTGEIALT